jgi:hypothetical protein
MAQLKPVPETQKNQKATGPRQKSGVSFPYYNLADSIKVASVMYAHGGSCDRAQLATLLKYKGVNNGSFLTRVTAAKMFGLIEQEGNQLRVADRGMKIVAPVDGDDAERAKVDAFLGVELFKKVFDEYNGRTLPPDVGLKNLMEQTFSIVKDRVVPTLRIMLESAEEAGFFRIAGNRSKMVMPLAPGRPSAQMESKTPPASESTQGPPPKQGGGGGSGWDGGQNLNIHPAIVGLLQELPQPGTQLSEKKRNALTAAFKAAVDWIYPSAESEQA